MRNRLPTLNLHARNESSAIGTALGERSLLSQHGHGKCSCRDVNRLGGLAGARGEGVALTSNLWRLPPLQERLSQPFFCQTSPFPESRTCCLGLILGYLELGN